MEIVEKKLLDLEDYENNPRNNDAAVESVANSIREFGFKVPIVIDSKNIIIAGHTRRRAAEMLGLETVPCIVADDLTPQQIKAFRLADNKTGELAGWDFSKLNEELEELRMIDFNMSGFGFDAFSDEIDDEEAPEDFKEYGEDIETEHKCPKCGYEW